MQRTHKIQKGHSGGRSMAAKEIELISVYAEPDPERDEKILKEAAQAIAKYIKRKAAKD